MKADWGAAFRGADQVDGRSLATLREAAPPLSPQLLPHSKIC